MKFKGNNIITDNDVTLTGTHLGETLDVVLDKQQQDLDELKGNVKWIYQNGGVGGSGNSGGGRSNEEWSIYATLDNTQIKSNNIILNGQGIYNLVVKINKPGGRNFKCDIQYKNVNGTQNPPSTYLNIDNVYTSQYNLQLNINETILVTVTDDDGETKQINAMYIVNPYEFNIKYIKTSGQEYYSEDNDIFIEDIQNEGLGLQINYSIGINATVKYKYSKFDGTYTDFTPLEFTQGSGKSQLLKVAEDSFFTNDKAGYYSTKVVIEITPENQQPITIEKSLNCNLIPKDLYLKIKSSSGVLYNDTTETNPYHFSVGNITFFVQAYQGANLNRKYNIVTKINGVVDSSNINTLSERENTEVSYLVQKDDWNTIEFILSTSNGQKQYSVKKYFYIYNSNQNLTFDTIGANALKRVYHFGTNIQSSECIPVFGNEAFIEMNKISNNKEVNWDFASMQDLSSFVFNVGFELSKTASDNEPLFTLKDESGLINQDNTNFINIYRKKITIGNSTTLDIFIPHYEKLGRNVTQNYHLLTIHKRYYIEKGNGNKYFELLIYIDGHLETTTIINANPKYTKLIFNNSVYNCNFLDILQFNVSDLSKLPQDSDISEYFYTWVYKFGRQSLVPNFDDMVTLHGVIQNNFVFDAGDNKKMVGVTIDAVRNLAKKINSPVLLLKVQDTKDYQNAIGTQNFVKWYEKHYNQEDTDESIGTIDVTLEYSENKSGLVPYSQSGTKFNIAIQGSSTKQNFAKNLELSIKSTDPENHTYIYTPNFIQEGTSGYTDKDIHNSFLPEHSYTLKADKVDSSHCNNNAIGAFVNNNTVKFKTGDTGIYKNYIKNCLTGFASLVFVQVDYINPDTQQTTTNVYFLGIYNFNLGRKSYYNLGYKPTNNLKDIGLKSGFGIYEIAIDKDNKFIDGLTVAEVQDNEPYWDFSQYDKLILQGYNDSDIAMYGDFVSNDTSISHSNDIEKLSLFNKHVTLAGGYAFDFIGKNFGSHEDKYNASLYNTTGQLKDKFKSLNQVPDYRDQYTRVLPQGSTKIVYQKKERINDATLSDLQNCVLGNIDQNILSYVNYQSLVEYYVICMAFGMLDSVQKNLNVKSWNDGKTFYIAFYDMDTALGKDNAGKKVGYYAFSDYWTILQDSTDLVDATVQRDFQPAGTLSAEAFFDVPSSYLFAIAKYASIALGKDLVSMYPLKLWSQLRRDSGELRNSEFFINKYFQGRLNNIGPELINLNYRAKYLPKADDTHYISDIESFNGSGIYETKEWLDNRLHTLDVYMGLSSTAPSYRYIQKYNKVTGIWETLKNSSGTDVFETELNTEEIPSNNSDIIIYKDIFSREGADNKYSQLIDINVQALSQSFLVMAQDSSVSRYYLEDPNKIYHLRFNPSGAQNLRLGGSDRWISISNLTPFYIGSSDIYINSLNLKNFNFDRAILNGSAINTSIYLPACEEIIFSNAQKCTNNATINNRNFPAVKTIDLSTSNMSQINISEIPLTTFKGNDMNSTNLNINCKNINSVSLENSIFSNSVRINTITTTPNIQGLQCKELDLSGVGQDIIIKNNQTLETLTLNNFNKIIIKDCPKLNRLYLNNCDNLQEFQMLNCSQYSADNSINMDLSKFTKLQIFTMKDTKHIVTIKLPNELKLQPAAFENTDIRNLTGKVYITGNRTFNNCPIQNISNIYVDSNCTDLSNTFSNVIGLTGEQAKTFLNNIPQVNNITNINYLFTNQSNITAPHTGTTYFTGFNKLSKVTTAVGVFAKTGVDYHHDDDFITFGSGMVNMDEFYGPLSNNSYLYIHEKGFTNLFKHINSINFLYTYPYYRIIKLCDNSGHLINNPDISYLFNNDLTNTNNLISINYLEFYSKDDVVLNYNQLFNSDNWSNLRYINNSFNNSINISDYRNLKLNKLKLYTINNSFKSINSDVLINMYDLLNWDFYLTNTEESIGNCFYYTIKYIKKQDWNTIWTKINNNIHYNNSISQLFQNTYLVSTDNIIPVTLQYITSLFSTFSNFNIVNSIEGVNDVQQLKLLEKIPLDVNVLITYFPKVVLFYSTFYNTTIKSVPKLNFFNRRIKTITPVYQVDTVGGVKTNSKRQINLIQYNYTQNITHIKNMFAMCNFINGSFKYNQEVYPKTELQLLDGTSLPDTEYYQQINSTNIKTIDPNVYEQDLIHPTTCIYETNYDIYTSKVIPQATEGEMVGQYILPPDFFAGCVSNCNISSIFQNSNIWGSLPKSLLSNLTNASNLNAAFNGVNVLPTYYNTFKFNHPTNSNIKYKKVYSYIPEGFFNTAVGLSNGFNFNLRYPSNNITDVTNLETVNYYYIVLDTSFNIIPVGFQNNSNYSGFVIVTNDGTKPFNIMFNTKLVTNNTCGDDGWSLSQTKCDNLFGSRYMQSASGNLFINPQTKPLNNWFINLDPIISISETTQGSIFPIATGNVSNLMVVSKPTNVYNIPANSRQWYQQVKNIQMR